MVDNSYCRNEERCQSWSTGDFIKHLDPQLLAYKKELFCLSLTSEETLKYLPPQEVYQMKITDYKQLLMDETINVKTPDTKH